MDYKEETQLGYRSSERAKYYKKEYSRGITWARFTMWRERAFVEKALRQCKISANDIILDIPCGTGTLGEIFPKFQFNVVASDISVEMMQLAREDYRRASFWGFIQADITETPFRKGTFKCVITLGLMHRLPDDIRKQALTEITSLSNRFIIISYSIDTPFQKLKQSLIRKIWSSHRSAPSPISMSGIREELKANGLTLKRKCKVMTFLSAEVVFLLAKNTA